MAMRTHGSITTTLLLLVGLHAQAQDDCKTKLMAVVHHMQQQVLNAPEQALKARLEITSQAEGEAPAVKMTTGLAVGLGRTIVENEHFSSFTDGDARVVVLHDEAQVLVYPQPTATKTSAANWEQFNDTLIRVSNVAQCRTERTVKGNEMTVELHVPGSVKGAVQSIHYTVDLDRQQVTDMSTRYRPHQQLSSYRVKFISYQPGLLDPRLKRPSVDLVLKDGKLRPAYTGHRLRDRRDPTVVQAQND
jgi:hypothetical protein